MTVEYQKILLAILTSNNKKRNSEIIDDSSYKADIIDTLRINRTYQKIMFKIYMIINIMLLRKLVNYL